MPIIAMTREMGSLGKDVKSVENLPKATLPAASRYRRD